MFKNTSLWTCKIEFIHIKPCCGYKDELYCLPCLESDCIKPEDNLQQNADDYCNICFTEALKSAPCVKSKCGHIFH